VKYNAALRSARMQEVIDHVDADPANEGTLEIGTGTPLAFGTLLVAIELEDPSFIESGGVITLAGVPLSATAVAGGTAVVGQIKDGSGVVVVSELTVGTTNAYNITLNAVAISAGQTVTLSSGTITHSNNT
jgi:hypothetical protein